MQHHQQQFSNNKKNEYNFHSLFLAFVAFVSSALIFESARNVLTWYLSQFWEVSGDVWQFLWSKFLRSTTADDYKLWVFGTYIIFNGVYLTSSLAFAALDWTQSLRRYKIQPGTNEPINGQKFKKVIKTILFNQIFVTLPLLIASYPLLKWRGIFDQVLTLPKFHHFVLNMLGYLVVEEIVFFYSHWLLHHRRIYKYIHKQHHEWTAPIGFAALYAHPVEHILSNLVPTILGPVIFGAHIATMWVWFSMALFNTVNTHSGYHLPFFPSPEAHDFHHLKFTQCYGVLGILDSLHGTDILFKSQQVYKRHFTSLSLTPVREIFPDVKEN